MAVPAIPAGEVSSPARPEKSAKSAVVCATFKQLAGHANLGTTARYIEGDHDARRKFVALI
jgi:hypothetical protein